MFDFTREYISQSMQSWYAHRAHTLTKKEESIILLLWNNNDNSSDLCRLWWYYAIEFDWFVCWVRFFKSVDSRRVFVRVLLFSFRFVSLHQFPTNWVMWCKMCDKAHAIRLNKAHHTFFSSVNVCSQGYAKKLTKNDKYYRLSFSRDLTIVRCLVWNT